MHDTIFIRHAGKEFTGARFLWSQGAGICQSIFYGGCCRADPASYSSFAADDPAMNVAAQQLLLELVTEAGSRR
jgi:hypothetical protein